MADSRWRKEQPSRGIAWSRETGAQTHASMQSSTFTRRAYSQELPAFWRKWDLSKETMRIVLEPPLAGSGPLGVTDPLVLNSLEIPILQPWELPGRGGPKAGP